MEFLILPTILSGLGNLVDGGGKYFRVLPMQHIFINLSTKANLDFGDLAKAQPNISQLMLIRWKRKQKPTD